MGADDTGFKGKAFWKSIRKVAEAGVVPYIQVTSQPIPIRQLPFGDVKRRRVDPERPFSNYRTKSRGGRNRVYCLVNGCRNQLRVDQVLVCSTECEEYLKESCEKILGILNTKPEYVYNDTLRSVKMARVTMKTLRYPHHIVAEAKEDELEGLDGNRYRGFVRRDNEGPGVGIVTNEALPITHRIGSRGGTRVDGGRIRGESPLAPGGGARSSFSTKATPCSSLGRASP